MPRRSSPSRANFSYDVMLEATRLYVQALPPYRVLAQNISDRIGRPVSPATLNGWVLDLGHAAKTPLEVSVELAPQWGGFLGVDGKTLRVNGEKNCLFVGVDHPSQDLVHALLLPEETSEGYVRLLTELVRDAGYPLKGVTSDFGPGFLKSHQDYFGKVPFQACRVHLERRLLKDIPKAKKSGKADLLAELRERIHQVAYAPSKQEAIARFGDLLLDRDRYGRYGKKGVVNHLQRYFPAYLSHFDLPGLPPDNNATENVIKQLSKKLRLMEGFHSLESAQAFIRLLIGCYRFKRFTDSRRSNTNGRSPLELAGVDTRRRDWLLYLLEREGV